VAKSLPTLGKSGVLFDTPLWSTSAGREGQTHHTFLVDVPDPPRAEVQAKVLEAHEGGAVVEEGSSPHLKCLPHTPAPPNRIDAGMLAMSTRKDGKEASADGQ
jgi:hypothetical protein